ncbi:reverse transcriptase, partial [Moniliophthora roreri MCA 2997]
MFFGLTNSPATFQALMNSIFADLIAQGKVAVYLDDILIYSTSLEEHHWTMHEVLKQLQENDLYLRPEKCEFDQEQVEDFSKIAHPLNDLTKKDCRWEWGMRQHQAFETLKGAFTKELILVMWDPAWPTRLEVDASGYATGGVILQQLEDRLWHPVAYRTNTQANPLSQIPTFQMTDAEDNQGQVVLHPERFMRIAITRMKGGELEERICKGVEKEAEVLQAVEELKKKGPQRLINGLLEWEEDNRLVYYKGKLYIPVDKGLHTDVLKQCHDAPTAGHLGEHGTLEQIQEEAEAALQMGKEKMKEAYEEGRRKAHKFKVGDKVWLAAKDIKIHQASRKLGSRQLEPFKVVECIGDLDYHLKLPPEMKVHNVFHVNCLSPWKGNEVNGQRAPLPEAVEVEGEEEHLVEEILDRYGEEEDSWEPTENLEHAKAKVKNFHKKNPNAPARVAAALFATLPWQELKNFTKATTDLAWEEGKRVGLGLLWTIDSREG